MSPSNGSTVGVSDPAAMSGCNGCHDRSLDHKFARPQMQFEKCGSTTPEA